MHQQASRVTLGECLNLSEPAALSAKAPQGSALRAKLDHTDEGLTADRERRCPRHLPEGPGTQLLQCGHWEGAGSFRGAGL